MWADALVLAAGDAIGGFFVAVIGDDVVAVAVAVAGVPTVEGFMGVKAASKSGIRIFFRAIVFVGAVMAGSTKDEVERLENFPHALQCLLLLCI